MHDMVVIECSYSVNGLGKLIVLCFMDLLVDRQRPLIWFGSRERDLIPSLDG